MKALKPLSFLYDQVVELKNSFFDRKIIRIYKPAVKVISIGNLTAGGTGKTPITDFCLKFLVADGKKVAVISRSYKADAGSACPVDVSHPFAARYYGDEPVLLAQKNPEVTVFVGPSKWQTARYAESKGKFDVFVIDDGFQHRRLHRDLNIVILDATESLNNYALIPEGRARESWQNLDRADVLLVTKSNLVSEAHLKELQARLPTGKEVLYFGYDLVNFQNTKTKEVVVPEKLAGKKFFLVSAIARPDVFEKMMLALGPIVGRRHYRDHHQYTVGDARQIQNEFQKSQADYLITTEKDVVKLKSVLKDAPLWGASLAVVEQKNQGRLREIISQTLS